MSKPGTLVHKLLCGAQRGSSLIELLIAIVVVGTIVTAVAFALTQSVKNTAETRYRELASTMAQDVIDVMRKEREVQGWVPFYGYFSDGTTLYCFNQLPNSIDTSSLASRSGPCGPAQYAVSRTSFQREVAVTRSSGTLEMLVTIRWNIGGDDQRELQMTHLLKNRR